MSGRRDGLLTIVTPSADVSVFPRMKKIVGVLGDTGRRHDHWYWVRADEEEPEGRCLLRGGGFSNKGLALRYVRFMAAVFRDALRDGAGRSFYCIGFAAAMPVALASLFKPLRYLYDNNDNLSLSYNWPGPVKWLIGLMERVVVRRAVVHMVPSLSRWTRGGDNLRIVANVPSTATLEAARMVASDEGLERREVLTIYANGRLTEERGIGVLERALAGWRDEDPLRVILAGRLQSAAAERLVKHSNVEYLGTIDNVRALAHYAEAHLAVTYYDPAIEINRLAEPNKWGDCVVMRTPFLVNEEVETARPFGEAGACLALPFHDADALKSLLRRLVSDRSELAACTDALASFEWKPWEQQFTLILDEYAPRTVES